MPGLAAADAHRPLAALAARVALRVAASQAAGPESTPPPTKSAASAREEVPAA